MNEFDEEILATLMDGKPRRFSRLLGEVSFSHNTLRLLRLHLDHLIDDALVRREKTCVKGLGKPSFTTSKYQNRALITWHEHSTGLELPMLSRNK